MTSLTDHGNAVGGGGNTFQDDDLVNWQGEHRSDTCGVYMIYNTYTQETWEPTRFWLLAWHILWINKYWLIDWLIDWRVAAALRHFTVYVFSYNCAASCFAHNLRTSTEIRYVITDFMIPSCIACCIASLHRYIDYWHPQVLPTVFFVYFFQTFGIITGRKWNNRTVG